jgi:hypothetical protein
MIDQLGVDEGILKAFREYTKVQTDAMLQQMNYYAQFRKYSIDTQLSAVKSWDNFITTMMGYNLKMFDQFK